MTAHIHTLTSHDVMTKLYDREPWVGEVVKLKKLINFQGKLASLRGFCKRRKVWDF